MGGKWSFVVAAEDETHILKRRHSSGKNSDFSCNRDAIFKNPEAFLG